MSHGILARTFISGSAPLLHLRIDALEMYLYCRIYDASLLAPIIMHFTVFTDYAFRVLIYLALDPERRVTINDIATSYGISKNHLMKVVNLLAKEGIVTASRGANGGLILSKPADEIMVSEIVRLTEDSFRPVECFRPDNQCIISPACGWKVVLGEALQAFNDVLAKYSVQDLIEKKVQLKKLLYST